MLLKYYWKIGCQCYFLCYLNPRLRLNKTKFYLNSCWIEYCLNTALMLPKTYFMITKIIILTSVRSDSCYLKLKCHFNATKYAVLPWNSNGSSRNTNWMLPKHYLNRLKYSFLKESTRIGRTFRIIQWRWLFKSSQRRQLIIDELIDDLLRFHQ